MTHPMPQIGQALSMVLQEERQRELQTPAPLFADSSALLSQSKHSIPPYRQPSQSSYSQPSAPPSSSHRRPSLFCNYCKRSGHTIDRCFKLQRQRDNPASFSEKSKRVAATVHTDGLLTSDHNPSSIPSFTQEQYTKLLALLNKHDLESSSHHSGDSTSAAMLAGKVFCVSTSSPHSKWILDSGATDHITPNLQLFSSYSPLSHDSFILMPNGKHAKIHHIGTIQLTPSLSLLNALHVPDFQYNLLSASKLAKQLSAQVIFSPDHCFLQVPSMKQPLAIGKEVGGLYLVDHTSCTSSLASTSFSSLPDKSFFCSMSTLELWHCRLGHMSFTNMKHLDVVSSCTTLPKSICQVCHYAKQQRTPFPDSTSCASHIFELIHVDLWGPYPHSTYNGCKYFLTIVDDYSRATWTHLLAAKSNAFPILKSFIFFIQTQFQTTVKTVRSDNGMEFSDNSATAFYASLGILHQTSCVGTPQQNGVVERKHKHLLETARALSFQSKVPVQFWGDSLLTATYLINRMPSSLLGHKTPYELLYGHSPSYSHLKTFGSLCLLLNPTETNLLLEVLPVYSLAIPPERRPTRSLIFLLIKFFLVGMFPSMRPTSPFIIFLPLLLIHYLLPFSSTMTTLTLLFPPLLLPLLFLLLLLILPPLPLLLHLLLHLHLPLLLLLNHLHLLLLFPLLILPLLSLSLPLIIFLL